jgi:mycothiol synthase
MIYDQDTPVAYCWTRHDPEANAARGENKGEIHMLGVDPAYRKIGIGTNILLAGLSHLKRQGIAVVELTADSEEPAALALYRSVGFEKYSIIEWFEKRLL